MKILLVGEGGREDALAWALAKSDRVQLLRCAPGSLGISRRAELVPIPAHAIDALVAHVQDVRYDLVVVGPEAPLCAGLADRLTSAGVPVFGPSAAAAAIEGSKVFAKEFMARHGIPTAPFRIFSDAAPARSFLESSEAHYPLVVKADGLAAGKGVVIARDARAAVEAASRMLSGGAFGAAGSRIVIEDLVPGREVSFFVLSDGERFKELAPCQDYKRALDGDRGPNTGGMGSYSPSAHLDPATGRLIVRSVIEPTLAGLAAEGRPFRGLLYAGVMLTDAGPVVLEFNARFGDPETQALLPRLDGDWVPLLYACATSGLDASPPRFKPEAAVCVVLASAGYPGTATPSVAIRGIEETERMAEVLVFHAGTGPGERGGYVTRGGRVLGVTALGATVAAARERAYDAAARIRFEGARMRSDIALDAVACTGGRSA